MSQEGFTGENRGQADSREDSHRVPVLSARGPLGHEPPRAPPPSLLAVLTPCVVTALVCGRDIGCAETNRNLDARLSARKGLFLCSSLRDNISLSLEGQIAVSGPLLCFVENRYPLGL